MTLGGNNNHQTNTNPLVSIITVCYNSEKYIKYAIESVLNQTYNNIEYIIIDGKSTDNTIDIIKNYEPKFKGKMTWVSEKDNGIYDAINKGIKMSSGKIIGILNSDDWYCRKTVNKIIKNFEKKIDIYHGKIFKVRKIGKSYYKKNEKIVDLSLITERMCINHTSCFVNRRCYKRKLYDSKFKIAADYKFILESYLSGAKFKYIDHCFTYMRIGGISSNNINTELEVYYIKKEVLGKKQLLLLTKKIISLYYLKFRKFIAATVLPKKTIEYFETKKWIKINIEEME